VDLLRALIAVFGIMTTLMCVASSAQDIRFNVCMGNGGGPSCAGGSTVSLTCAEYRAIGGGGPATAPALGARLCKVYDANGKQRQLDYNVAHIYSKGGGECGWTLFTVICLPAR